MSRTELGAPRIRIWAGDTGSAEAAGEHWDAVVEDTQRIAGLAAAGAPLAFEYHGGTLTDSPDPTLELLRRVDRARRHVLAARRRTATTSKP